MVREGKIYGMVRWNHVPWVIRSISSASSFCECRRATIWKSNSRMAGEMTEEKMMDGGDLVVDF